MRFLIWYIVAWWNNSVPGHGWRGAGYRGRCLAPIENINLLHLLWQTSFYDLVRKWGLPWSKKETGGCLQLLLKLFVNQRYLCFYRCKQTHAACWLLSHFISSSFLPWVQHLHFDPNIIFIPSLERCSSNGLCCSPAVSRLNSHYLHELYSTPLTD